MHYEISFNGPNADQEAIDGMAEYLGPTTWTKVVEAALALDEGVEVDYDFQFLNMTLAMAGVTGYPIHALGRTYCPKAYSEWKDQS